MARCAGAADLAPRTRSLFWKLCGSGTGEGFTPKPNWGVCAILASDEATRAPRTLQTRSGSGGVPCARSVRSIVIRVSRCLGGSSFREGSPAARPFAELKRGTVTPTAPALLEPGAVYIGCIGADPNVTFKIGIGEVPLLHQVTFSIWPDTDSMAAFARGDCPHGRAIRAVRDGNWFREELYARFRVIGSEGRWNGANPLVPAP